MGEETTTDRLAEIEGQPEPQPVQIREGRWRTRAGQVRNVVAYPQDHENYTAYYPWWDGEQTTWANDGRWTDRPSSMDLVEYLGPIEPEQEQTITPDDVAAEALAGVNEWPNVQTLQRKLETTELALLEQQQRNEQLVTEGSQQRMEIAELQAQVRFLKNRELTLGTRLQDKKAVSTKRLQQVEELRSEVSHVQGLLGESSRRVSELETLVKDLRNINATAEKSAEAAARDKADSEHRLHVVAAEFGVQLETNNRLQTQLEAVKAELVQVSKDRQTLQIELDAYELRSHNVSDRFEEGWDAGTARAVETIAEWTEPFRTCGSQGLALAVLQNLPHIMRTLTGLADED